MPILSSVLVLIGFSWPHVSGSTEGTSRGCRRSVGKPYTNSPPSSIVTFLAAASRHSLIGAFRCPNNEQTLRQQVEEHQHYSTEQPSLHHPQFHTHSLNRSRPFIPRLRRILSCQAASFDAKQRKRERESLVDVLFKGGGIGIGGWIGDLPPSLSLCPLSVLRCW